MSEMWFTVRLRSKMARERVGNLDIDSPTIMIDSWQETWTVVIVATDLLD